MNKLLMSMMSAALVLSPTLWAGEKIDETLATKANGHVEIEVLSGKVKVISWDKNEVRIVGELSDDAEGYIAEVSGSGSVFFKVNMPERQWGSWSDEGSMLDIYVPKQNSVEFEGVNSSIELSDIHGGANINTINGGITASNLTNRIKLDTINGRIKSNDLDGEIKLGSVNGAVVDRNSKGELNVDTVNGKIDVVSTAKEVELTNVNGRMRAELTNVDEVDVGTVNGHLDLTISLNKKGELSFSSVSGDADITFINELSARFDIENHTGGSISNNLTDDKPEKERYTSGKSLRFKVGGGDSKVQIDTVSGDITLSKK